MSRWPLVPLGEVLRAARDQHKVSVDGTYPNVGIYSYGRGLFSKPPISGSATSAKTLMRVRKGQFIYSRLFAFEGAYGLVTEPFDGCFVSNEYPTFECDSALLLPQFVAAFFRCPRTWEAVRVHSSGVGHRRQRVQPDQLLRHTIPLPPLTEQHRLIEKLDALAAKIEEAKRLAADSDTQLDNLCRSLLYQRGDGSCPRTPMYELVRLREPDVAVLATETYHFAGVYCFGRGVFRGPTKTGMEFAYRTLTRLNVGDFVYPKLMAWEGALAVVPPECDGLVVSTEFPVFEINQERVLPEVLDVYFRNPSVWPALSGASTGTNVRRRRLNPTDFLRYEFPLPAMAIQHRLKAVNERATAIRREAAISSQQLHAMLPAILDRAFNGQL